MAKQCIYCGRPLAKDDARFCNDCGRLQVAPDNSASGAVAPSAIKVKLPPKEYTSRDDLPSTQQEASLPGPVASSSSIFPSPRGQIASPPPSRLPKRPTRLKSPASSAAEEKARAVDPLPVAEVSPLDEVSSVVEDKAQPASSAHADKVRPPTVVPTSQPTPAEEASTMVLPNWREELAQLRKEQEQARINASAPSAKKVERVANEPPPLSRRSADAFSPPGEAPRVSSPRREPNTPLPVPEEKRAFEAPRQMPNTPQPQNSARSGQNTSLPLPEKKPLTDVSRRELRVKVWEPETTIRSTPPAPVEKREPAPIPAVEQNPFASAAFDAEEKLSGDEELESVTWQAPRDPLPVNRKQSLAGEEKQPSVARDEGQSSAREKKPSAAREESLLPVREEKLSALVREEGQLPAGEEKPALADDKHQPDRGERRQEAREEKRRLVDGENDQQKVMEGKEDIEDLPTVPLAVPEMVKQEPSIKIERTSTPAPKKWSVPRSGNVEDLPTRPMAASSSVSAPARAPQQPSTAQAQSPEKDQTEVLSPSAQRIAKSHSLPGAYGQAPTAQAGVQAAETDVDPLAPRARSTQSPSQLGISFDPASLPPLPPGPLPMPGNVRPRAEIQGAQEPQARSAVLFPDMPGQRPPAFDSPATRVSSTANTSKPTADAMQREKPRKQRHTGRLMVVILLLLVFVGAGAGVALNRDWVMQYFQTPAQNQPYQAYQSSALGFSLDYTQGWSVSVDQVQSTVHFADSSHTGQANLTRATASGQVSDYLNQQIIHLGLTGSKAAPAATIGGASWQVVQGTVALSGATYMAMLYATQHNGHVYLLELLAPQSSFTHIDQSDFAHMRSSFQFL